MQKREYKYPPKGDQQKEKEVTEKEDRPPSRLDLGETLAKKREQA